MNAEQASKRPMREPTQLAYGEGRCRWFPGSNAIPPAVPAVRLDVVERLSIDAWLAAVGVGTVVRMGQHVPAVHLVVQRRVA